VINTLAAFSVMRVFALIFGNKPQQMTERSPEPLWAVVLPMTAIAGFALHVPMVLNTLGLLPEWAMLNKDVALLLTWSSILGLSLSGIIYLGNALPKPVRLPWKPLQDLLAYDFYTPKIYRSSVVGSVDRISRLTDWFDRYLVDGLVNFVGISSIFSGETLKYGNSGQTQFYVLTIALGLIGMAVLLSWSFLSRLM
jgi:NAD(P)H-quinone oxidoreductase subunit 5